jgi:hypothetical protein
MKLLVTGKLGYHMGKMVGALDQIWSIIDVTGYTLAKLKMNGWYKQLNYLPLR